ncbi:MAG TPA: hypothetical protein VF736_20950 [Pyrinomonadaceae bacterium]|jgi:hypothetical protein
MPNVPAAPSEAQTESEASSKRGGALRRAAGLPLVREVLVFLAFCLFTAGVTWPYVTRMRDAVADPGDPYLVAWILWWDYHQTFRDPLNLFHSNLFYPLPYTLAYSENCYGIALPFFPLFALGARPLTVHSVAMFFGFAACGYGAFRLARTLTGSQGVAWVAGIVFAFVPFRFYLMSHLPYLWAVWVPLLLEALVLFARERSRRRAAWLGCAFFLTGLTTVSWFSLSLFPFALSAAVLMTRHRLWRDREFWRRGAAALLLGSLALLPFMLPYYIVSKLNGFKRDIEEVKAWSASPMHWLAAEGRNKLWRGMGDNLPDGGRFRLFPGLLPVLLSLAAILLVRRTDAHAAVFQADVGAARARLLRRLDPLVAFAFALAVVAVGFDRSEAFGRLFVYVTSERALALLTAAVVARLCLAYPACFRALSPNLAETLRSPRRGEAFWLGLLLCAVGFSYSLGWNFFVYRILYDLLPIFKSMRVPLRGAMYAYLGLALLAGLGVRRLAELARERGGRYLRPAAVYAAACVLLLAELNAAPLEFVRGDVYPDAVTLWLKRATMRGGVVVLPAGPTVNHRHVLRSADHEKPLVVGISGFGSPYEDRIEWYTRSGPISFQLLKLLEETPASYLVVENNLVEAERRADYATFLGRAVASGRLRFINRFDGRDDLYAVVKTEPEARAEASPPAELRVRDWASLLEEDAVNVLGQQTDWSLALYRLHLVARGRMPRYEEFMADARAVGRGLVPGSEEAARELERRLRALAGEWERGAEFGSLFEGDDAQYAARLYANAGLAADAAGRDALAAALSSKAETRAGALVRVASDPRVAEREAWRALLLLHYFGFLRRDPDAPPDRDLSGFNFWLADLERNHDPERVALAFRDSIEYKRTKGQ